MKSLAFIVFFMQILSSVWASGYYYRGQFREISSLNNSGVLEFDNVQTSKKRSFW